jgi:hypothetical protein
MKTLEDSHVIVEVGLCECHAVTTTRVHHHDFPELHAEGTSPAEAGGHLKNLFLRAVEGAEFGDCRSALLEALHDVQDFIDGQT